MHNIQCSAPPTPSVGLAAHVAVHVLAEFDMPGAGPAVRLPGASDVRILLPEGFLEVLAKAAWF